jgi:hypothetical protein
MSLGLGTGPPPVQGAAVHWICRRVSCFDRQAPGCAAGWTGAKSEPATASRGTQRNEGINGIYVAASAALAPKRHHQRPSLGSRARAMATNALPCRACPCCVHHALMAVANAPLMHQVAHRGRTILHRQYERVPSTTPASLASMPWVLPLLESRSLHLYRLLPRRQATGGCQAAIAYVRAMRGALLLLPDEARPCS